MKIPTTTATTEIRPSRFVGPTKEREVGGAVGEIISDQRQAAVFATGEGLSPQALATGSETKDLPLPASGDAGAALITFVSEAAPKVKSGLAQLASMGCEVILIGHVSPGAPEAPGGATNGLATDAPNSMPAPQSKGQPRPDTDPEPRPVASSCAGFTMREEQVFELLTRGRCNREIARTLWVTEETVKAHLTSVYRKLGVKSRAEAIAVHFETATQAPREELRSSRHRAS